MTALPASDHIDGTPGEVFAAVGEMVLEHAHLSDSLYLFFLHYLKLPGSTSVTLFETLNNRDRGDLIRQLVAAQDPRPGDEAAVAHLLRCFDICTENRNIIAHCSFEGMTPDGARLHKHPTGVSRTSWDLCVPLEALQQAAEEMTEIAGHIMLLWHHLVDRETADGQPLPRKPPQPRKLSLFRLPEGHEDG